MDIGKIVVVQGLSLKVLDILSNEDVLLKQDEGLKVIAVDNSTITFERLIDGSVNKVSKVALEFVVE